MAGVLSSAFTPLPPPADPPVARAALARLRDSGHPLHAIVSGDERAANLLTAIFGASSFLTRVILAEPDFAARCFSDDPAALMRELLAHTRAAAEAESEAAIMRALRRIRRRVALLVALADMAGYWPLQTVMENLTAFADAAVSAALAFCLRDLHARGRLRHADPAASGLFVLAMGKLGAGELNYSSDIDLIVFHDPGRAPLAAGEEAGPLFVRLVRRLVKILSETTGDGYVFRTDLRLRPDPGSTQVAISTEAALLYYQSTGQNWERAAMIKARPCAGDMALGAAFLSELSPWIWRKHLDFAAIADVQALKRQIHAVKGHGEIASAGHDIKLGRGGIREIEFFVQTQQLIAGGRDPSLRGRATLDMLHALARARWITPPVAGEMDAAYRELRRLEHRLQMLHDHQTQTLPTDDAALECFARFAGFATREDFAAHLRPILETVQGHYDALFADQPELAVQQGSLVFTGVDDDPETLRTLARLGFARPADAARLIRGWHYGRYPAMRAETARESLTMLTPALLAAIARAGDADAGLAAFDRFLQGLPAGVQLFALLRAHPKWLDLLITILVTAPLLAAQLARRPRLFDAVLEPDFFAELPDGKEIGRMLAAAAPEELDDEDTLDATRRFVNEWKFRIGVRLIAETLTHQEAEAACAALAEAAIGRMLQLAERQMCRAHGVVEGGAMSVIAMGRLGGREMTATSDLDLIIVCDFPPDAESAGPRALAAGQYFSRLAQRLINALSAPTAEGTLYEVDMRLRPSGSQGPVATHIASFAAYHAESAWLWEHLALTRARAVAGHAALARRVGKIVRATLTRRRDPRAVWAEVAAMRRRIGKEKPPHSAWDIKLAAGGLIDIEFIVQALQLVHARAHPSILHQNTAQALAALRDAGLLPETEAEQLSAALDLYQRLIHILRLCVREGFRPAGKEVPEGFARLVAAATGAPGLDAATATLRDHQRRVTEIFARFTSAS
ncbi:MAG TPA: bifunctional [glutamine synthetase] adenylyltransferase/[glutamine synthetase]-adenylyl-L-tyrosine phosphorylase [Thermopetrobacter sp.]|nr:bifunctional [glutamine synthetase] adenylyltransferase/[glutamine synthetase]-adenylyl-L-tyrosine phosphorylase [Thermopetrobacter sp.]